MNEMYNAVNRLLERLTFSNNRELVYDLYAYMWDMRGVVSLLNSYVKWLGKYFFNAQTNKLIKDNFLID